jgi:hypothetical protein
VPLKFFEQIVFRPGIRKPEFGIRRGLVANTNRRIEERIEELEREVAVINLIFQTATGFDPNFTEDAELLRGLIEEFPRSSQTGLCCAARTRFSLSRARTIEVLRAGVGRFWRVEAGLYNSLLYFPIAFRSQSASEQTEHLDAEERLEHAI